jgi:ABC-type antimicrobial peptide transport system permease subunit
MGTIVIYQQIQHVKNRPLGYNKDNLLQIGLTEPMKEKFSAIKQDLVATGNIRNAAESMLNVLYMGSTTNNFSWQGKNFREEVIITQNWVSPEYMNTTGMQIIEGRDFYSPSKLDSSSVIINESLAKLMGPGKATGKMISRGKKTFTVVGVTADVIYGNMYGSGYPMIFLCYPENFNYLYVGLKNNSNTHEALAQVQSIIKKYDPDYSYEYSFVNDEFQKIFQSEKLTSKLSTIFAILTVFISCLGLFGLAAYTAEQRRKEIGIRKILGASVEGITTMLSMDFIKLVLLSFIIAFPFAWWLMNKWLADFAYRISVSWSIFLVSAVIAIITALLTVSIQSIQAAVRNPVKNLRSE